MSILFLPPQSAGSVTIADATETTSGKIRIATSAEATAGTNDVTAMTPAKVKSVVDASLVGGVTYQGTLDASAPADLSNATKGDLYIISVAGTYAGKTWAVGDHLLVNADMGGTLDSSKIDKVDNTDAVTSVAGRTGAVTLSTADISGLATVASTGAYSDLSGTPTLATVATTGAYSDLSGTPTLGTAAAEDVGTSAGNVVQLDGSARLPAVDGSQLTNLPAPSIDLNDLTDVTFTAGAGIDNYVLTFNNSTGLWGAEAVPSAPKSFYSFGTINVTYTAPAISDNRCQYYNLATGGITLTIPSASSSNAIGGLIVVRNTSTSTASVICPSANLADGTTATTFDLEPEEARSFVWFSTTALHEISASSLGQLTNVDLTGLANGDVLIYNSTSGKWEAGSTPATSVALDDLTDVTITAAASGEVLRYNGSAWVDAQLAYSDLSGAPTNVSSFTNDAGYLTDITAENLGDLADVDLTGLADGEIIIYNATSGNWEANPPPAPQATTTSVGLIEIAENAEATAGTATDKALVPSNISSITTAQLDNSAGTMLESANNLSDLANVATARTNLGLATVASTGAYSDLSGAPTNVSSFTNDAGYISDITAENLGDLADVDLTGLANGEIIIYNSTSGKWEANPPPAPLATETSVGLIEIATNAEATAGTATDKALVPSNISSITTAQLDNSAGTLLESANNLSDLANAATARTNLGLGTAAVENVGTSAGNVVQLNGSAQLPALDGSLLTGITADLSGVTLDDISDVSYPVAPAKDQLLQWNSTTSKWEPVDATTVTSDSPGSTYSVTTHKGLEEVYVLSPSASCTVSIPTAATVGEGFKYQFKLLTANPLTINETIDGVSGFTLNNQYSSITIVSDGTAWYLI